MSFKTARRANLEELELAVQNVSPCGVISQAYLDLFARAANPEEGRVLNINSLNNIGAQNNVRYFNFAHSVFVQ